MSRCRAGLVGLLLRKEGFFWLHLDELIAVPSINYKLSDFRFWRYAGDEWRFGNMVLGLSLIYLNIN